MSSAICFNLDQSKILSSGNRLMKVKAKEKFHAIVLMIEILAYQTQFRCHIYTDILIGRSFPFMEMYKKSYHKSHI